MTKCSPRQTPGLLERLASGVIICAEGYLFELERRGYLQAGAFVPEVVLDRPEEVKQLHREFVHAGSDVVEAFTYYAHREKLRIIGKAVSAVVYGLTTRAENILSKRERIINGLSGINRKAKHQTNLARQGGNDAGDP